jgi:hypothetical protein
MNEYLLFDAHQRPIMRLQNFLCSELSMQLDRNVDKTLHRTIFTHIHDRMSSHACMTMGLLMMNELSHEPQ